MRVTTDFYCSALIRRIFAEGGFAAVEQKGASEAGAIFLKHRHRDGTVTLYAPAPQAFFEEETSGERRFERRLEHADPFAVDDLIARERRFDPDLWVVEAETGDLAPYITIAGTE